MADVQRGGRAQDWDEFSSATQRQLATFAAFAFAVGVVIGSVIASIVWWVAA